MKSNKSFITEGTPPSGVRVSPQAISLLTRRVSEAQGAQLLDIVGRQAVSLCSSDQRVDVSARRRLLSYIGGEIDQRVHQALIGFYVEMLSRVRTDCDTFVPIQRFDVLVGQVPQNAPHLAAARRDHCRNSPTPAGRVPHERQLIAGKARASQRNGTRTARSHLLRIHVGAVREVVRHSAAGDAGSGAAGSSPTASGGSKPHSSISRA